MTKADLLKYIDSQVSNGNMGVLMIRKYVEEHMPKDGRWTMQKFDGLLYVVCSVCGNKATSHITNYCPNCGAKMKGEEE